jgi:integrase
VRGDGRTFLRGVIYWVAFMRNGKEVRESSGETGQERAEKYLRRRQKEIAAEELAGKPFETRKQRQMLFGDLLDSLEADYKLKGGRALPQLQSHLKHVRGYFGDMRALAITGDTVDKYIAARLAEKEPPAVATINRETEVLRHAFQLAVKARKLSAAPAVRRLKEDNARQGFFERADFEAVVAKLPDYLQDFTRLGYLSAWRKGEIQGLLWTDVDRDAKTIRLRPEESKNGRARLLALEGDLAQLIERRWKDREYQREDKTTTFSLYVFHRDGAPIGDFKKAWATACKKAGVAGRLFHDLRRSSVRNMIRAGVSEGVAMAVSGHRTRSMFDRYNISSEQDIRQALQKTQVYIESQPEKRNVVEFAQAAQA